MGRYVYEDQSNPFYKQVALLLLAGDSDSLESLEYHIYYLIDYMKKLTILPSHSFFS